MKRNKFSLSHYKLLSCDMGQLVPIGLVEVLPGDTIQQATSALVRVSPLLAPVMHPVHVRIHHWFVPHRLVWPGWEDFITGGPDGNNAFEPPYMTAPSVQNDLTDYYGIPPGYGAPNAYSAMPIRGYNLIWNEWYRDQDLQTEAPVDLANGLDNTTDRSIRNVAWEKDYFTSSRPWPQKGTGVSIPIGLTAPVVPIGDQIPTFTVNGTGVVLAGNNLTPGAEFNPQPGGSGLGGMEWNNPKLQADLTSATAVNINQLREAFAIQRYQEARARYGSRYTEYLAYLGVRSSDARLQRPEYLGGGKQTIQFSEVLQTGPGEEPSVVGDLKGHGIGALRSNRYRRFFEEHGYIHSFLSVKPKTIYTQALHKTWSRFTKEDYFQKELQHIGQQEVLNKEVMASHSDPLGVFGYQDRYDEYRRMESGVAGDFRDTLDFWHYARIFSGDVALNNDFVTAIPTKRVNAVQTEQVLWIMANHSIQARRMLARTGSSHIY